MKKLPYPDSRSGWESNGFRRVLVWFAEWAFFVGTAFAVCHSETVPELIFVQAPRQSETYCAPDGGVFLPSSRYAEGMRLVRFASGDPKREPLCLTPDFVSACDPAVSFDGNQILFAGKKNKDDRWQIWRIDREGGNPTQLTTQPNDSIMPLYVGSLFHLDDPAPSDQFVFVSSEGSQANECGAGANLALYAAKRDGGSVAKITFNLSSDFDPDVLPNGRVVFTSWRRNGFEKDGLGTFGLMAVSIDGTDLLPYYGNLTPPAFKGMAKIAPESERVYYIESDRSNGLGAGDIAYVSMRRPLHSHAVLSRAENGQYVFPCPLPDGGLIASYRVNEASACFELYRIDPATGERKENLYASPEWHCLDAQVLAPHPEVKGRASVANLEKQTGFFYCLSIYNSDIPAVKALAPGSIKRVRIIEGLPLLQDGARVTIDPAQFAFAGGNSNPNTGTPFTASRILGVANVEEDGSFHVELPAQIPVAFQLLDERGMSIAAQRSWTWTIPWEKRGCIGCHEDREMAPPNRLAAAVVRKAQALTLPPERRRMVDFVHEIKPILQAKCSGAGCHSGGEKHLNLDVGKLVEHPGQGAVFFAAYENLLAPAAGRENERYVIPGSAKESPLIWRILGERTGGLEPSNATESETLQMPPHTILSDVEKTLLIEWIDLGALYDIRAIAAAADAKKTKQE